MTTPNHIMPPITDHGPLETMARAIIEAQGYSPSENELARARDEVPGIIAALTEAGYAIVPIEPTEAMRSEGSDRLFGSAVDDWGAEAANIYRGMLDAYTPIDSEKGE